jgi:hypothetical protein
MAASESALSVAADISTIATFAVVVTGGLLYGLGSVRPLKIQAKSRTDLHEEGYQITVVTTTVKSRTRNNRTINDYYMISDPGPAQRLRLWQTETDATPFSGSSLNNAGCSLEAHDILTLRGELNAAGLPYGNKTLVVVTVGNRPYAAKIRR